MTTISTDETLTSGGPRPTDPIIDLDVHETFKSWNELLPYLKNPWRKLLEQGA